MSKWTCSYAILYIFFDFLLLYSNNAVFLICIKISTKIRDDFNKEKLYYSKMFTNYITYTLLLTVHITFLLNI